MRRPRSHARLPPLERLLEHGWSVMLYDGDCVLCAGSVRFVAARSRRRRLAFAAMQGDAARAALAARGRSAHAPDTLLVLEGEHVLERSAAVLRLADLMGWPWPLIAALTRRVPCALRDALYARVARSRYRLLGRRRSCLLVDPDERRRFLI